MRQWLILSMGLVPFLLYADGVGKATLVGDGVVDVGRYPASEARQAQFKVRNDGGGVLQLLKLRKGCGCTDAKMDRQQLTPGEVATIDLTIRGGSLRGTYTKYAYLETSDPHARIVRLGVSGEAVPLVDIRPSRHIYGGRLKGDTPWVKHFSLMGDMALDPPVTKSSHPVLVELVQVSSNASYRAYDLNVTLEPTTHKGTFTCTVTLPLREPTGHPPVTISLSAKIGVDLVAIPRVLLIPLSKTPYRRDIRLRIAGNRDRVLRPEELVLPTLDQVTYRVKPDPWRGLQVTAEFGPIFTERLSLSKRSALRFSVPGAAPVEVQCRFKE